MLKIEGYTLKEKIYESMNSVIYTGIRNLDMLPVVIKILLREYPTPAEIAWFRLEYKISSELRINGIAAMYSIEKCGNSLAMIMEYFDGQPLSRILEVRKIGLEEFLKIAIQLADVLGEIHNRKVIHKNISPSNILWNPDMEKLKIIDFGISSSLSGEIQEGMIPNYLEGSLSYISPEQTGRMNRKIDYRSDYYSMGATFYELLTGQKPYQSEDLIEIVHFHIAKNPVPPQHINPKIPKVVSDIILKLMAKNAEDRYQSSFGVKYDLEQCQADLGMIYFEIGKKDIPEKLEVPQKLFGREEEIEMLVKDFYYVSETQTSHMTLVSGYSGVGKSSLVSELYKFILEKKGYFITGKNEQLSRNIPYASFIQAFSGLIKQILREDNQSLSNWREKILNTVGASAQVIINVIPMLEVILGKQPDIPELSPQKSQNRFNRIFQSFVQVLASKEHPLVIHIDDAQWADSSSLKMLELFMTDPDIKNILFICSYRENEVDNTHPFMRVLEQIRAEGKTISTISLKPLDFHHTNMLVSETLRSEPESTKEFAALCIRKTDGNPFFLNQFLNTLYHEKLLEFDKQEGRWKWDIQKIEEKKITNNVVELMVDKIQRLSAETQDVLKIAACYGNTFDIAMLSTIHEKPEMETANALFEALQEGLVLPSNSICKIENSGIGSNASYQFLHDRLQQAAYSMIEEGHRKSLHLKIGKLLLKNTLHSSMDENIFDIANHFNIGMQFVENREDRTRLAELNLLAGKKAKDSAAFEVAFKYLNYGIGLLGDNSWESDYNITLQIHVEISEAAYLCGNYEVMESFTDMVLKNTSELLDKLKVYEVRMRAFVAQNKRLEAVKLGLSILELLGIHIPENPKKTDILLGLLKTRLMLANRKPDDLLNLPVMKDPYKLWSIRILLDLGSAAYFTKPSVFVLMGYQSIELSLKYGNNSLSNNAYSVYAMTCGTLEDIPSCLKWRELSYHLFERYNTLETRSKDIAIYYYLLAHYDTSIGDIVKVLHEGYLIGLESGDTEYAALCIHMCVTLKYYQGYPLKELEEEAASVTTIINRLNQESLLERIRTTHQGILNLIYPTENPAVLTGRILDEERLVKDFEYRNNKTGPFYLYSTKMTLSMLFYRYDDAVEDVKKAREFLDGGVSTIVIPIFYFYESLIYLQTYQHSSKIEKLRILKTVLANQIKLKKRASHAPMHHLHKYYLVQAELSKALGKDLKAQGYYEKAIQTAAKNEYINEEALASERAAIFYLARGNERLAFTYLMHARFCYEKWGALAKVKHLDDTYAFYKDSIEKKGLEVLSKSSSDAAVMRNSQHLDLTSVLKASQAISGEIVYKNLIDKLMKVIVENAGAQKIALIDIKEGRLYMEVLYQVGDEEATVFDRDHQTSEQDVISKFASLSIIHYIARTKETLVLDDAGRKDQFKNDRYMKENKPKSILCMPLIYQGNMLRILYIENNLTTNAFTEERMKVLNLLSAQMVISIENSKVYEHLEELIRERTKRLEVMATHDNLTGLPNRKFLQESMTYAIAAAKRQKTLLAVLFIDLDGFKIINDTLGHDSGDVVLRTVSDRMLKCVRESDMIARLGGDEFAVVLDKLEEEQTIYSICQRIVNEIAKPIPLGGKQGCVTSSIGISFYPDHGDDINVLIKKADHAMYIAKKSGKNKYVVYAEEFCQQ